MASGSRNVPQRGSTPVTATPLKTPGGAPPKKGRVGLLNWWGEPDLHNSYCAELLFDLVERAEAAGFEFEIIGAGNGPAGTVPPFPPLQKVLDAKFDALFLNSIWEEPYIGELHKNGFPIVSLDFQPRGSPVDAVIFSGQQGGKLAAKALLDSGQRSVAVVSRFRKDLAVPPGADPWIEDDTAIDRRVGLQSALTGTSIELWPMVPWTASHADDQVPESHRRMKRIIEDAGAPPDAICASDGDIALETARVFASLGYKIPQDVGLITFDVTSSIEFHQPLPYSTITYDWKEMAARAWELMMKRLGSQEQRVAPPRLIELEGRFIDRGSLPKRTRA